MRGYPRFYIWASIAGTNTRILGIYMLQFNFMLGSIFISFCFIFIIIYMKKLLDSDWLRAVQFSCNTSAKSVTPVQITHRYSGL